MSMFFVDIQVKLYLGIIQHLSRRCMWD